MKTEYTMEVINKFCDNKISHTSNNCQDSITKF